MLLSGFGTLHVLSGRLNAEGSVFATLIDSAIRFTSHGHELWYCGALPAPLALLFAIEASASWLWLLVMWRAKRQRRSVERISTIVARTDYSAATTATI
jgi:hypothetical protein